MEYYKSSQPVPGKGEAWVLYECTDDQSIVRQLTVLPETGEAKQVPDPVVTKLYRPEVLEQITGEEFERYWTQAEDPQH